jgi:hypothetical protein
MDAVVDAMKSFRATFEDDELARAVVLTNIIELERVLYFWANDGLPCTRSALVSALARNWVAERRTTDSDPPLASHG